MKVDLLLANSIGHSSSGKYIIHSPSRWSEAVSIERHFAYYPFYLGTLSSLLKRETSLKIKLIDGCLKRYSYDEYYRKIIFFKPEFLFMETSSLMYAENLELALNVKKNCGTKLLFAGPHSSVYPSDVILSGVDFIFKGEYERSVLKFFKEKKFMGKQKVFYPEKHSDFKKMPWPEDDDISRFEYSLPGEPSSKFREIQIYATRGCLGNCSFCVARNVYYSKPFHIARNPVDVMNEVLFLKNKYLELEGLFFDEEDHFADKAFIQQWISLLIERKNRLKIEAMGRIDHIPLYLIKRLKKAGYYKLRIGIESFDSLIQKKIGKQISVYQFEQFAAECKRENMEVYATFQVGLPGSTRKSDLWTLSKIRKYLSLNLITNLQVSIFTPFPGTPVYQELESKGYLLTTDLSKYNGGAKSVVNWPEYSANSIENTCKEYLLLRDHLQLLNRLTPKVFCSWIFDKLRKHGVKDVLLKIKRRIQVEKEYLTANYKNIS